jgi:hypothetical protein
MPPTPCGYSRALPAGARPAEGGRCGGALGLYERILSAARAGGSAVPGGAHSRRRGDAGGGGGGPARRLEGQAEGARDLAGAAWCAERRRARKLEREAAREGIALGSPSEVAARSSSVCARVRRRPLNEAMALARAAPLAAAPVHAVGAARAALGQWAQGACAVRGGGAARPGNRGILSISGGLGALRTARGSACAAGGGGGAGRGRGACTGHGC